MPLPASPPDEIEIRHHRAGPVHVFTAADGMPGLHHAHVDLDRAFATLASVTAELVRLQWGVAELWFADRPFADVAAELARPNRDPCRRVCFLRSSRLAAGRA